MSHFSHLQPSPFPPLPRPAVTSLLLLFLLFFLYFNFLNLSFNFSFKLYLRSFYTLLQSKLNPFITKRLFFFHVLHINMSNPYFTYMIFVATLVPFVWYLFLFLFFLQNILNAIKRLGGDAGPCCCRRDVMDGSSMWGKRSVKWLPSRLHGRKMEEKWNI